MLDLRLIRGLLGRLVPQDAKRVKQSLRKLLAAVL
jgi:hypothetical protein